MWKAQTIIEQLKAFNLNFLAFFKSYPLFNSRSKIMSTLCLHGMAMKEAMFPHRGMYSPPVLLFILSPFMLRKEELMDAKTEIF